MKNKIKQSILKIIYREKSDSESYIKYLKNLGMKIGDGSIVYTPRNVTIDLTRPWLVEIGKNVKITKGVTILTHGYDWSVIRHKYGTMIGSSGKVKIGNNVFIGMNTTILKGVTIGNNVIIGANTLVNKNINNDVVVAGNPARVIMTIDEYFEKRKNEYLNEAKELAIEYKNRYNEIPPISIFNEFFPIFVNRSEDLGGLGLNFKHDNEFCEDLYNDFRNSQPIFNGYNEFLKWCEIIQ